MREIILDGRHMKTREEAHTYMQEKLDIDSYYGKNLDALWDALTSQANSLSIKLKNKDKLIDYLDGYGKNIISVFKEARDENENIEFALVEED